MYVKIIGVVSKLMADQLAIYNATLACHQAFRDLDAVPVLEEWAENCLADLNLWANGAGALKVGKASLDARLSLNLDAKIFVVSLLGMLQIFVGKCFEIGSKEHNNTPEASELSQAIQDVNDIMGQLSRITISIRKAGTDARIRRADASYDPNHPQIEALSQHLQLLLLVKPSQNGTLEAKASSQGILVLSCINDTTVIDSHLIDSHSLTAIQRRLIEANLKRRNRFLYAQRHAIKLSERDQIPSISTPVPQKLPLPPVLNTLKGTTEKHGVPKVYSTTTATEVQDPIALPTQASAQPATTVISTTSSRTTYPRPPTFRSNQNVFQCPCCCQTLSTSMSRGSLWKKHLSRDILPYTCVLEDCPNPENLYHSKDLWLSHMSTDHGGTFTWACLACNDSNARPVFYEESALIEHLQGRHSRGIKPQQIPMLVSAWQRKRPASIHSCPLCGFKDQDSNAVLNHTAEHVHSFSLRSLPWAPREDSSDDGLYDGYYKEHPYFDTGRSVGTEGGRSRSTVSSEQRSLEKLPAVDSGGETTGNNRLTEEKIRGILKNPNVEKDLLNEFLNGIEIQESFQEPSPLASISNLGSVLGNQSNYEEAEAMYQQAFKGQEEALLEYPDTFTSLNNGSSVLADQLKYEEAETMHRQALKSYKNALGPEHPDTLTSVSKLGLVLTDQGKYKEAETMHRQALHGREEVLGPEHRDTLTSVSQLGSVLAGQGKYKEAETMHQRALHGREEVLGPEHRDTLTSVSQLGSVLAGQSKYKEAEIMLRQALHGYEKVLGPEHRDALTSVSQLGSVLAGQGKYKEAEIMHRRALHGREEVLGPEHPDTLTSVSKLGSGLANQGKYKEAEAIYRRALHGQEKVLGPEHPDTLTSVRHLGSVLDDQGKYKEAETMHQRALHGYEKVLGPEHPDTLTRLSNLGSVLAKQGKYKEAEAMHRQALHGYEKVLSPGHRDALTSVSQLGSVLAGQGKYKEAEIMHRRALHGREEVLGPEHPDTLNSVNNLGSALAGQGKYEEAVTMHRQALHGQETVLGLEHPDTLASLNNLRSLLSNQGKYEEAEAMYQQAFKG